MEKEICPLCKTRANFFTNFRNMDYYSCPNCLGIFLGSKYLLSKEDEKKRYDTHNNDVEDSGYQNFAMDLVESIAANHDKKETILDYGCEPGPVVASLLEDRGYKVNLYDPFYMDKKENLEKTYDLIILSEVAEHFCRPDKEFSFLRSILNDKGSIYVKTKRYTCDIDFDSWTYKNDSTHVFFYTIKTFVWIRKRYRFKKLYIYPSYVILEA